MTGKELYLDIRIKSRLYTALGRKEAIAFLTGLIFGASLKTS